MRVEHGPAAAAEQAEQFLDLAHRPPGDVAAGGRELLQRLPERARLGAGSTVLHVDDEQRRAIAEAGWAAEAGGAVGLLLFGGDDVVPRLHGRSPIVEA